jgi:hypothetical protein
MKSGHADLPLHYGKVPIWLAQRMSALGGAIVESIVMEYGRNALLQKLSDPFWFQSLGCVLGMDWHSSGNYYFRNGRFEEVRSTGNLPSLAFTFAAVGASIRAKRPRN